MQYKPEWSFERGVKLSPFLFQQGNMKREKIYPQPKISVLVTRFENVIQHYERQGRRSGVVLRRGVKDTNDGRRDGLA